MKNVIPYNINLELGKGFNSVKGEALGSIFSPDFEYFENTGARGQEVYFKMTRIESSEQLYSELGISVEASGRYGLFAGSAKFDFASSSNYNSFSVFYLLSVKVKNAVKRIKKYQILPQIIKWLEDGESERFRRGFGDSYIEAITTGGEFFAIYEFMCTDETSKTQISAQLEAEYGAAMLSGVEVQAKFNSTVSSASKKSQLKLTTYQSGGIGNRIATNPEEMIERAREFPNIVTGDNGVAYEVVFQSYETLPLPDGPNYVQLENKKFVLDSYAKDIIMWRQSLAELDYIIDKPEEFEFDTINDEAQMDLIIDQRIAIGKIINDYTAHASQCADSVTECTVFVPQKEDLDKVDKRKLPPRKRSLDQVVIYDGINYTGKPNYLVKGKYKDGNSFGLANDSIKSIKIPKNWQVTLFEHWYYNGINLPLTESCPDLSVYSFSDLASSILIGEVGETIAPETPPEAPIQTPQGNDAGGKINPYTKFKERSYMRLAR